MVEFERLITDVAKRLLMYAVTTLPPDVKEALKEAHRRERSPLGRAQLEAIIKNAELAEETGRPICQDTGVINFYVRAGFYPTKLHRVEEALRRAVKEATTEVPLRPNAVNPFTNENTGNNLGVGIPNIEWEFTRSDYMELTAFPKGAGSENVCAMKMMLPGEGVRGVRRFVIDSVLKAGGMPCPPTVIGIGIGGGSDTAMRLAKRALLRPLNEPNPDPRIARLEEEIYRDVNSTGIGPMGLGGDVTALAVKVEYAYRHPASYPVAVAFNCWASRRSTARIYRDGTIEYITHGQG